MASDGDDTQELRASTPVEFQLRRKDDMKKAQFRQSTAQWALLRGFLMGGVLLYKGSDLGINIATILTWIVAGDVLIIGTAMGVKGWEVVSQIRGPK